MEEPMRVTEAPAEGLPCAVDKPSVIIDAGFAIPALPPAMTPSKQARRYAWIILIVPSLSAAPVLIC